jgi:hypothetical protein
MASGIYERFLANVLNKEIDMEADTINVALFDNVHTFTAADNDWSDISANEIAGTGYTTKGAALATKAVTQASTTKFDADDTAWTTATFSAYHAVIYDDTLAADDLIANIDFGGVKTVTAGTFTITWHANGIITLA